MFVVFSLKTDIFLVFACLVFDLSEHQSVVYIAVVGIVNDHFQRRQFLFRQALHLSEQLYARLGN